MKKLSIDPIGSVQKPQEVNVYVNALAQEWDQQKTVENTWFLWWTTRKASLVQAVKFLMNSLDELINFVEGLIDLGPDKKATVLAAIGALYDYVIKETMPIWLKPFNSQIRNFLINIIISSAIDFIVSKYNRGTWGTGGDGNGQEEPQV